MKVRRIVKTAGYGFIGFCAVSLLADKVDLNPVVSQFAGFAGAFLGTLVGPRVRRRDSSARNPEAGATGEKFDVAGQE